MERLGAKLFFEEETPGRPLVIVQFYGPKFDDKNVARYISTFPTIEKLDFENTKVTYRGLTCLSHLSNLRVLVFSLDGRPSHMTRKAFTFFGKLTSLRYLTIVGYRVQENDVRVLRERRPGLVILAEDAGPAKPR
jgi:hypothetical protein